MTADVLPPGPRLPVALQTATWIARPWEFMERCAARYGDTFTFKLAGGKTIVMVSRPEAVREVFTASPDVLHAGESNRMLLPVVGGNSVLLLDGDAHKEQRRLLMPPFRGSHLKSYLDTMREVAEAEIAQWPRGQVVKLHPRMQTLTLEIILRVVFGLKDGERLDQLRAGLLHMLSLTTNLVSQMMLLMVGPEQMRTALGRRLFRDVDRLIYQEITARRQVDDLEERSDVLSMLLQARHTDGDPMADSEIRDELVTLLLAGHETTAAGLGWAVERIIRHPDIHSRLVEETRAGNLEYVDAVVKETLRLRPVIALVTRQLNEPMVIGGVPLPAGVTVAPSIYLMHRRPEIYPEPEQFRPERFLGSNAGTYTWIPFGGGVRRCVGAIFAECEMRAVLVALFAHNQIRPDRPEPEADQRRAITHIPGRGATAILQ